MDDNNQKMDNNNQNVRHPLLSALKMFEVAARSAFDTAAAFWRPWSGKREKLEVPIRQQPSNAPSEQVRQPIKRDQDVTVRKKPKASTKRTKSPKPLVQEATVEKTPKAPTKHSLKQEQELEQKERAQKTERLRKLRLAKEAGDRKKDQP